MALADVSKMNVKVNILTQIAHRWDFNSSLKKTCTRVSSLNKRTRDAVLKEIGMFAAS